MAARALTRSGAISPGYFTWLASDGWGKQSAVVNEIQEFAVGAITVELESKKIHGKSGRIALSLGWSAIPNCDTGTQEGRINFLPNTIVVVVDCPPSLVTAAFVQATLRNLSKITDKWRNEK